MTLRGLTATCALLVLAGCGSSAGGAPPTTTVSGSTEASTSLFGIGNGRSLSVTCQGEGPATVILMAGKGNGAEDWRLVLDPADPAHEAPGDDVGAGLGDIHRSADAVLPSVAHFARVCAYDRPDTRMTGEDRSTTRAQPHTVDADVEDLSALLGRLGSTGPVVLVAHSYSGFIVELFTRTHPGAVAGLVMVDAGSEQLAATTSAARFANFDQTNRTYSAEAPEGVELLDAVAKIKAAPPAHRVPAAVLSADKPTRTDLLPQGFDLDGLLTFPEWLAAQSRLATALGARYVPNTDSGHNIYLYSPAVVTDAVRAVVEQVSPARPAPTPTR